MTEQLLQYIWQFQYFNKSNLTTANGESLQIIHAGTHNTNQGPDFLDAKIKCGSTVLAGSIEIHINASEWDEHAHSNDKNYNNVILHVVFKEDKKLKLNFPVLSLEDRISNLFLEKYESLMQAKKFIPCEEQLHKINEITFLAWKERLMIERLQEKAIYIEKILQKNNHYWEQTFWQMLTRNFGMKVNADAFEEIAVAIPINILAKHKNQIHQLEALLLGQAGLLEGDFTDDYPIMLQKEYRFFKKKYSLPRTYIPVNFLRMRPAGFPTLRLSQLATLILQSNHLFSVIKEANSLKEVEKMFSVAANDYWHVHYVFDELSGHKEKMLGKQMIHNIILNTLVTMLYAYGWYNNYEEFKEKAIRWTQELPGEENIITTGFEMLGIKTTCAYDSQALIQLKTKYCSEKRCLQCAVGNAILKTQN